MSITTKETIISHLESSELFPILLSDVWEWLGYGSKEDALRGFRQLEMAESIDFIQLRQEADRSIKPLPEVLMTIDCFKLWAMGAQTEKGKGARLYYLQVEKEWKAGRSESSRISADHVAAYNFDRSSFQPFLGESPVAAKIFLGWQNVLPSETKPSPEFALSSGEMQSALNGAFLNLNRSDLAMNKLFHFIDRIPTTQTMGMDAVGNLTEALTEAGLLISKLQKENAKQKSEIASLKDERRKMRMGIDPLCQEKTPSHIRVEESDTYF